MCDDLPLETEEDLQENNQRLDDLRALCQGLKPWIGFQAEEGQGIVWRTFLGGQALGFISGTCSKPCSFAMKRVCLVLMTFSLQDFGRRCATMIFPTKLLWRICTTSSRSAKRYFYFQGLKKKKQNSETTKERMRWGFFIIHNLLDSQSNLGLSCRELPMQFRERRVFSLPTFTSRCSESQVSELKLPVNVAGEK